MSGYPREPERGDTDVIGARIGAQVIDSIFMIVLVFMPVFLFGGLGSAAGDDAGAGLGGLGFLIGIVLAIGYGFLLEGLWDGYTIGKRLFGIKVVKEDGSPCDLGSAFVRNLLEIIDGFFYYLVGFLVMAFSDRRQRLGDRLAGTVVVRDTLSDTGASDDASDAEADTTG